MGLKSFNGEVWSNVHMEIMNEMFKANSITVDGKVGNDGYTKNATKLIQKYFKDDQLFNTGKKCFDEIMPLTSISIAPIIPIRLLILKCYLLGIKNRQISFCFHFWLDAILQLKAD